LYSQHTYFLKEDGINKNNFEQSIHATKGGNNSSSKMQNKKILKAKTTGSAKKTTEIIFH